MTLTTNIILYYIQTHDTQKVQYIIVHYVYIICLDTVNVLKTTEMETNLNNLNLHENFKQISLGI